MIDAADRYADGLATDDAGNVWACLVPAGGGAGLRVYGPGGNLLGQVAPRTISRCQNITFGDADRRSLYFVNEGTVYRVRVTVPGPP